MKNFDTTGTKYDDAIIEYLDINKDNQFNLETTAIAASRVFSVPQNSESLELAKNNPAILKMWDIFQKNNEIQNATIGQIIEVQKASHSFLQLINKREMLQAAAIITIKNQLNTLNIENQEIYEIIKKLAGNVLDRFNQLERKLEHVEAVASLTQWIQNLKWRKYKEEPEIKRFFRILEDYYFNSAKNFTLQNLESLKTALDQSDINPFDSISIKDFTSTLIDELTEYNFNESIRHSPYNSKYSFEDVNSKITLPFLSSLYLISEEYSHLTKRRYPLDKIRDNVKHATLCYMKKDCGIDVTSKLEFYHLGIELLNGRRLIEFLDSPAPQAARSEKSIADSPISIDTSQERYQEYRDTLLTLLDAESHGKIDDEGRAILKLKQALLKLSDEEASRIEESVIKEASKIEESVIEESSRIEGSAVRNRQNEDKYKEEVRKALDGNPEITAKKRLLLELSAQSLGISSDSAGKCVEEIVEEIEVANRSAESLYKMALKYFWGEGVSLDAAKAFNLCEKAKEKGLLDAHAFLANFYLSGVVVARDYQKAYQLFYQARSKQQGYSRKDFLLDASFITKRRLEKTKEALEALEKEFAAGNAVAASIIGYAYLAGSTRTNDHIMGASWTRKAAEQGNVWAQVTLGLCYYKGRGVEFNKPLAKQLFQRAAEQGFPNQEFHQQVLWCGTWLESELEPPKILF